MNKHGCEPTSFQPSKRLYRFSNSCINNRPLVQCFPKHSMTSNFFFTPHLRSLRSTFSSKQLKKTDPEFRSVFETRSADSSGIYGRQKNLKNLRFLRVAGETTMHSEIKDGKIYGTIPLKAKLTVSLKKRNSSSPKNVNVFFFVETFMTECSNNKI